MEKLKRAIEEIAKYNPSFKKIEVNNWVLDDSYSYDGSTVTGKEITKVLYYLSNYLCDNKVEITNHFERYATMIDLSRNAVYKVEYFKSVIRRQAMMGINTILLYTEDTYEVKDLPYFGYMRGRYLESEIKELVEYAEIFGIELMPCIQTLGHMGQFLRWGHNLPIKDQLTVMMPNTDKTLEAIDKMIAACRRMYKTNTIHIGLDEAFGFGLGNYLKHNGYQNQYEIFVKHLHKVNEICKKHGFEYIQIWSDMFFRMANTADEYYDTTSPIPEHIIDDIPTNVELIYWDYYNKNYEVYDKMLKRHLNFKRGVGMASGTWIWTKLFYDKKQTDDTALHALNATINNGVKDFYLTQWHDDGAPCDYESNFLGLFDLSYPALTNNGQMKEEVFKLIMGEEYQDYIDCAKMNECTMMPLGLLWDDILNGIFLNNEVLINRDTMTSTLNTLNEVLALKEKSDLNVFTNKHCYVTLKALKYKLECRMALLDAYNNTKDYTKVLELADLSIKALYELKNTFREMWMGRYKPFGYDVIQSRLISLIDRFDELKIRISELQSGKIDKIDELEEKAEIYQYNRFNHQDIFFSCIHILGY